MDALVIGRGGLGVDVRPRLQQKSEAARYGDAEDRSHLRLFPRMFPLTTLVAVSAESVKCAYCLAKECVFQLTCPGCRSHAIASRNALQRDAPHWQCCTLNAFAFC